LLRNCLLKLIGAKIEEKREVMGRQGRRCKKLLDDLQEKESTTSHSKELTL
jgi:hypothetical protein